VIAILLKIAVAIIIVFGAFRIILGWVLPRPAVAQFDAFIFSSYKLFFQIFIVALAALIGWAIWHLATQQN
jgi:hypothetical protein